jgi:RNA polymerase sigma-70 factor, ECF subfamily
MARGELVAVARTPMIHNAWARPRRAFRWWRRWPWASLLRNSQERASYDTEAIPTSARGTALTVECEQFIRQYERQILNYLWRVTGDQQTAYDLTQEVFLRAWQHFDTIRQYAHPHTWLFRVASNLAFTYLRRRVLVGSRTSLLDEEHDPASSDPAWRLAERDLVRQTLLQLAPKRRAALVLREVYGLTAAEVGRALGMSEPAVRMALHRAREQFRDLYAREGGTGDGD